MIKISYIQEYVHFYRTCYLHSTVSLFEQLSEHHLFLSSSTMLFFSDFLTQFLLDISRTFLIYNFTIMNRTSFSKLLAPCWLNLTLIQREYSYAYLRLLSLDFQYLWKIWMLPRMTKPKRQWEKMDYFCHQKRFILFLWLIDCFRHPEQASKLSILLLFQDLYLRDERKNGQHMFSQWERRDLYWYCCWD